MSKDNLILFPKKSKPVLEMSETELRWTISGTLLLILALSVGLNSAIFQNPAQQKTAQSQEVAPRGLASVPPLVEISWEKRAFEVLAKTEPRQLNGAGKTPSLFDKFNFGVLGGQYAISQKEGKVARVDFAPRTEGTPRKIANRHQFLKEYRSLMVGAPGDIESLSATTQGDISLENYRFVSENGRTLAEVQLKLDSADRLLSLQVQ